MKKVLSRIMLVCLSAIVAFSVVGCQAGKVDDSEKTIEVMIYNAGYGIDWFTELEKEFEANTDYDIVVKESSNENNFENMIRAGGKNTTTDLMIVSDAFGKYVYNGSKMVNGYEYCFEPLDEVYNYKHDGEDKTIGEKMWKDYRDSYLFDVEIDGKAESHYYIAPWASGFTGLMYNESVYAKAGLDHAPRTTDELVEFCEIIKNKNMTTDDGKTKITPFLYSGDAGYWDYMFYNWWAQYESLKGIDNFYNAKISDSAIPDAQTSMGIFDQKGIIGSLNCLSDVLLPSKNYAPYNVEELEFTTAQARFITGQAAMMPCGDWLENEMKKVSSIDTSQIMPMRNPIISAISDKLSFAAESKSTRETNLRSLVDYVDGGAKPTYATDEKVEADAAIVAAARRVNYTIGNAHQAVIPVFATAKEGAKEFLKFMYSDANLAKYMANTTGSIMPFDFDYKSAECYNGLSDFAKEKLSIMDNSDWFLFPAAVYPSVFIGILTPVRVTTSIMITVGSHDDSTRKTPEQLIKATKEYYEPIMGKLLADSGLV